MRLGFWVEGLGFLFVVGAGVLKAGMFTASGTWTRQIFTLPSKDGISVGFQSRV